MANEDRGWLESLKHYVSAPRRAFESLQRPIDANEYPTEYTTASPLVNITKGDIDKATEAAMAVSGGGMSTKPIRAYHSSPHDFERFDLAKIGTGEGAQVYGHGLYFAENPAVSGQGGQYWNQFLNKFSGPEKEAAQKLSRSGFDREAAAAKLQPVIDSYANPLKHKDPEFAARRLAEVQRQQDMLLSGKPVGPRTYEVNINADPAQMLDWDKPLRSQARSIQDFAERRRLEPSQSGESLYRSMGMNKERATKALLDEAGIPGIRYLDEGSRNAQPILKTTPAGDIISSHYPPPTSNYVVFNPSIIDIVKKYGLAGLAAPPVVAGAMKEKTAMKQFILTIDIPTSPVRDSVYVAQMLREVAATVEYQVPMMNHHHVYNRYGVQKYEWTAGDTGNIDAARKRA